MHRFVQLRLSLVVPALLLMFGMAITVAENANESQPWETISSSDGSQPTPRHEAAAVVIGEQLYLIGGRGVRPVEHYDSAAGTWQTLGAPPDERSHFQPVYYQGLIYLLGGFYCCFPNEPVFSHIQLYDPVQDIWSVGDEIPPARRRGGAAAVLYNDKLYMLGGNSLGHNGGAVSWFDEYDPATSSWRTLADAPSARDHFSAVMVGSKLIAASGRQSSQPNTFANTVATVDIYDFETGLWSTADEPIPTPRAGAMAVAYGSEVIVIGGEISDSLLALDVVEAFNVETGQWRALQSLQQARHSGGAGIIGDYLHVATGGRNRGGGGETELHERLLLKPAQQPPADSDVDGLTDTDETSLYQTDPLDPDTDDDLLDDGREVSLGTDPNDADTDNDTLTDGVEVLTHLTNPLLVDSDEDGLTDDNEIKVYSTNPLRKDSDADGLLDGDEISRGMNPSDSDTDKDGLSDFIEIDSAGTNPLLRDSDSDGLSDGQEYNIYRTDPTLTDSDADGLDDLTELNAGLNPMAADSDGDGVGDAAELNAEPPRVAQSGSSGSGGALFILPLILALFVPRSLYCRLLRR